MIKILKFIVLLCFFISGMCGLVYEVVWARMLTLTFGNTTFALSTILTSFMIGLAIGSIVFGKIVDYGLNPLKIYAYLEAGVGFYALMFANFLRFQERFYFLYKAESSFYLSSLFLFFFCFILLLFPTILMGGTLPVLCKYFVDNFDKRGKKIGELYALNTFGAVLGSFLSGYYFILNLGISGTISLIASLNLLIALIILIIEKIFKKDVEIKEEKFFVAKIPSKINYKNYILLFLFFISGFTALVYEVTWTRILSLILGSSIYAFSTVLTTFLFGISVGSYLFILIFRKREVNLFLFGVIEIIIGTFCILLIPLFNEFAYYSYIVHSVFKESFITLSLLKFLLCFIIMIFPTLFFGATFPLVAQIFTKSLKDLGKETGWVYFSNTVGSTLGSFLSGFLLIPLIGITKSIIFAVSLNILIGNILILSEKFNKKKIIIPIFSVLILSFAYPFSNLNKKLLVSGVYLYVEDIIKSKKQILEGLKSQKLLFYKEGVSSIVSVHERRGNRYLKVNGKTDASTGGDMPTQILLGHIPMLLNDKKERILVIGFGSGVTAASVAKYDAKEIYVIEIEKEVLNAAKFFKDVNQDVLSNKKVKIVIADGRHFIQSSKKNFDVIISEPSNPWMAGIGNLFSREFYKVSKQRLNEDGVFCQWLHGYSMDPYLFKVILNTFLKVFPNSTLWSSQIGDYLLIGFKGKKRLRIDYEKLNNFLKRNKRIQEDLKIAGLSSPYALKSCFLIGNQDLKKIARGTSINTDDFPILEFLAPQSLFLNTTIINLFGVLNFKKDEEIFINLPKDNKIISELHLSLGDAYFKKGLIENAMEEYEYAIKLNKNLLKSYHNLAKIYLNRNLFLKAESILRRSLLIKNNLNSHKLLAEIYLNQGLKEKAKQEYEEILKLDNKNFDSIFNIGEIHFQDGKYKNAIVFYKRALKLNQKEIKVKSRLGEAELKIKNYDEAFKILNECINQKPSSSSFKLLGDLYFETGKLGEAFNSYKKALELDRNSVPILVSIGKVLFKLTDLKGATEHFKKALNLDPYNKEAIEYLHKIANI